MFVGALMVWLGVIAPGHIAMASQIDGQAAVSEKVTKFTAGSIVRTALIDLRMDGDADEEDYRIASILLGLAGQIEPDNPEIARRRVEAAWGAGDDSGVIAATRDLLKLDPEDTVAQLRLISARINARQTVGERLDAYDRFLGPAGERIDPSVRSRLALDAALLIREQGDVEKFVKMLEMAVNLDRTNKEAAALAATYFAQQLDDPIGRFDLLSNLLLADPLDPNVHMSLAKELASQGAYAAAKRFYFNAASLQAAGGRDLSEPLIIQGLLIDWLNDGPLAVAKQLSARLQQQKAQAAAMARAQPGANVPDPSTLTLSVPFGRVQVLAAAAAGDRDLVIEAITGYEIAIREQVDVLLDRLRRPAGMTDEDVQNMIFVLVLDKQMLRLWADVEIGTVQTTLDSLRADGTPEEPLAAIQGWVWVRYGEIDRAVEILTPLIEHDPGAQTGLALAYETAGEIDKAVGHYRAIIEKFPLSLHSAWAASRLSRLLGPDDVGYEYAEALTKRIGAVPAWVDQMVRNPRAFIALEARPVSSVLSGFEQSAIRLRLRHMAPIPLGIGVGRTLSSRFLFAPRVEAQTDVLLSGAVPEVVDIDRRLRLDPREELDVVVWPDAGYTGWLLEVLESHSTRVSWRVIQGFMLAKTAGYVPGPGSLATNTTSVGRRPSLVTQLTVDELVDRIIDGPPEELVETISGVRSLLLAPGPGATVLDEAAAERIAQATAQRYATLDLISRAMMLAVLPHARLAPSMEPFDAAAREERDDALLPLVLVTRVIDAEDPLLAKAIENPATTEFASLIKERLAADSSCFAKLTADTALPRKVQPDAGDLP